MFQFLIGWLQTQNFSSSTSQFLSFNSLQVGYKPFSCLKNEESSLCFNSLQVGYKPYTLYWNLKQFNCFNSLQVGYKPSKRPQPNGLYLVFQFLIGWLQTGCSTVIGSSFPYKACFNSLQVGYKRVFRLLFRHSREVSIPYRLATNVPIGFTISYWIHEFQFLIGWLQTISDTNI